MDIKVRKTTVKPFVKWVGGKGQLLKTFENYYPEELFNGEIEKYIEPFVGGGAVLFDVLQRFNIKKAYIFDINKDLTNAYSSIKENVQPLTDYLKEQENKYLKLASNERKDFYYEIREKYNLSTPCFNSSQDIQVERAGQFIFLNKTCFNGLYRVNRGGLFNVPMGDYKNPNICDTENLFGISELLQNVEIFNSDYKKCTEYADNKTLVYFDPPYRPLNNTSNFTSYSKYDFTDDDQIELAKFYADIKKTNAYLMLSNSDPKNVDESDTFFDNLYNDFYINTVQAKRRKIA